jgi:hypothetical protein
LISITALIAVLVAGIAVLAFVALRRNANSQQAENAVAAVQQAAPATTPADASQPPAAPQEAPKPVEPPPPAPTAAAPAATTPTSGQRGSADAAARKKAAAAAAKTPEVAPPTEPVAAPPPPPPVEPAPPPPTPAVAPVTFKQVKLLVAQGDARRDRDAALRLAGDHLTILDRSEKAELLTLPYSSITGAIFSRSKQPKWKGADGKEQELRVDLGKMGFFRGERNWLILTRAVVIRLEDTDLRTVLPAFQERSGLKIQR